MTSAASEQGRAAEALARDFLRAKGLTLLSTNYRCRGGEIDLVMQDGGELVFVEVRLRRNPHFGSALESVDRRKQQRIILAARHYLQRQATDETPCRFDVLGIDGNGKLHWLRNAFDLM